MQLGSGSTDTGKALKFLNEFIFTEEFGSRPTAPKVVVIMTDGHDRDEKVRFVCGWSVIFSLTPPGAHVPNCGLYPYFQFF